jgi:hypothetical protein
MWRSIRRVALWGAPAVIAVLGVAHVVSAASAAGVSAQDKTATIKLTLNTAGKALLSADHGRLGATLSILKSSPTPSQTHTESVHLMQQKAHGKAKK